MSRITIATLASHTAQQVFDQVARHLLTQKVRSKLLVFNDEDEIVDERCVYRSPDGLQCAAGCLIGDDEYHKSWDTGGGSTWSVIARQMGVDAHMSLIEELQNLHDTDDPDDWAAALGRLAQTLDLSDAVVEQYA
jgi:hypothetical protein